MELRGPFVPQGTGAGSTRGLGAVGVPLLPLPPSWGSPKRRLRGAGFLAQMDAWAGTEELLAELQVRRGAGVSTASPLEGGPLPRRALGWLLGG